MNAGAPYGSSNAHHYLDSHQQPQLPSHGHEPVPSSGYHYSQQPQHQHQHQQSLLPSAHYASGNAYYYPTPAPHAPSHSGHYAHQPLALPAVSTAPPPGPVGPPAPEAEMDRTGQDPPTRGGPKPKVTATLWEDEGTLCFQVETNGICVARREDNHMINGTKLLNVAGMTRGRRDGILKSEKVRNVVKIGPMHLKGVWIPFEQALKFANNEKITDRLYPLFVHNIGTLLQHPAPTNPSRGRVEEIGSQSQPSSQANAGVTAQAVSHSQSLTPSGVSHSASRPALDRAHTFPTPPASSSNVIGMPAGSPYEWTGHNAAPVPSSQPSALDSSARSLPTTPIAASGSSTIQGLHHYQTPQYEPPRHGYSQPSQGQYQQYPTSVPSHHDYVSGSHYSADRGTYTYNPPTGSLPSEHLTPDSKPSPQRTGSGRATPRAIAQPGSQWQSGGYSTPQRQHTLPSSHLSYMAGETRSSSHQSNGYGAPSSVPSSTSQSYQYSNGGSGSAKRGRDDDDNEHDPYGRPSAADASLKRRRTGGDGGLAHPSAVSRSTIAQSR